MTLTSRVSLGISKAIFLGEHTDRYLPNFEVLQKAHLPVIIFSLYNFQIDTRIHSNFFFLSFNNTHKKAAHRDKAG